MISAWTPAAVAPLTPARSWRTIQVKEGLSAGLGLLLAGKVSHVAAFYRLRGSAQTTSAYWNYHALIADVTESRPSCGHWNPLLLTKHSRRQTATVDEIFELGDDAWWRRLTTCIEWLYQSETFCEAPVLLHRLAMKAISSVKPGADSVIYSLVPCNTTIESAQTRCPTSLLTQKREHCCSHYTLLPFVRYQIK